MRKIYMTIRTVYIYHWNFQCNVIHKHGATICQWIRCNFPHWFCVVAHPWEREMAGMQEYKWERRRETMKWKSAYKIWSRNQSENVDNRCESVKAACHVDPRRTCARPVCTNDSPRGVRHHAYLQCGGLCSIWNVWKWRCVTSVLRYDHN